MLLGFYVATMMRRWWNQISALPDVKLLAMTLNGLVLPDSNDGEKELKLKKTILRYCMLSYTLLMAEITKPGKSKADLIDIVSEKSLILPKEEVAFDGQDMAKHWWVPINWACKLVQMNLPMMKDAKEIIGQLNKFQNGLQKLLEYHENPLPALCAQAVHIMAWGFLIIGAFTDQSCEGTHHAAWIPLLDFPWTQSLILMILFSWLRMGEVCRSPFDGDSVYDLKVLQEIDIQIYTASLALQTGQVPIDIYEV